MKKKPGINGEYVEIESKDRLFDSVIPTFFTIGTPVIIQFMYAFDSGSRKFDWLLPLVIWIFSIIFWISSSGIYIFRSKKWIWNDEVIEEKNRYLSSARITSRKFWSHWWVRFPIGLLFLTVGIQAYIGNQDFAAQWISIILIMSAFLTPFVFIAELAIVPLLILVILAFIKIVKLTPISIVVMFSFAILGTTLFFVLSRHRNKIEKNELKQNKSNNENTKDEEIDNVKTNS